jgi:outer membrane protein OmpA-like peptidoglycan-associated protein
MAFNLLDSVKGIFTSDFVSNAASSLGESESSITKAISGIVPSVLGGVITKATSGDHGAGTVLQMAKDAAGSGASGNLSNLFSGGTNALSGGMDTVKGLLGDKVSGITSAISSYAGIKESSASSLLGAAAPAALGVLGQHAQQDNINAGSLAHMLSSQKDQILSALPSGLGSLSGLLGLGSVASSISGEIKQAASSAGSGLGSAASSISGGVKQAAASASHYADEAKEKASGGMKFLLPLILGILVIALLIYLFKGCNGSEAPVAAADTTQVHADTTAMAPAGPVSIKVKLPDGTELDAYKGGIEDQLVAFLSTDYAKLGADSLKKTWFDFDNLNFKTGSAEITPESQHQIDNITAILKAFPKTKIKIGGYTDKTGSEPGNKKLSGERATAVKTALEKAGVGAQVIGADGYGSDFAKFPATSPESDRVKDRHVSVSVRL